MSLLRHYRAYLVESATGLTMLGWYPAIMAKSLPWVLVFAAGCIAGSLLSLDAPWVTIALLSAPGLIGWLYVNVLMTRVHFADLKSRMTVNG